MPLPGVQNRQDGNHQGTAPDTLPCMGLFLQTSGLFLNNNNSFAFLDAKRENYARRRAEKPDKALPNATLVPHNDLKKHKSLLNVKERRAVSGPFYLLNPIKIFNKCIAPDRRV